MRAAMTTEQARSRSLTARRVIAGTEPSRRATSVSGRGRTVLVATALTSTVLDLAAKVWASSELADGGIDLPGPLDLQLAHNRGAAFSLFTGQRPGVMVAVTAAATLLLAVIAWRGMFGPMPGGLILGGAVANLTDRVVGGSVVDMLHTGWWPTFNLADVFLTTGVFLLCVGALGRPDTESASPRRG